jgi:hypothetical protein
VALAAADHDHRCWCAQCGNFIISGTAVQRLDTGPGCATGASRGISSTWLATVAARVWWLPYSGSQIAMKPWRSSVSRRTEEAEGPVMRMALEDRSES